MSNSASDGPVVAFVEHHGFTPTRARFLVSIPFDVHRRFAHGGLTGTDLLRAYRQAFDYGLAAALRSFEPAPDPPPATCEPSPSESAYRGRRG